MSFVCKATRTAFNRVAGSSNRFVLSLTEPRNLLDCESFSLSNLSNDVPIKANSPIGTITHSGFEITEADEMYHTVWQNVDGLKEEVRLSPLFREGARVTKVLVEDFDTFEVGDALLEIEGSVEQ